MELTVPKPDPHFKPFRDEQPIAFKTRWGFLVETGSICQILTHCTSVLLQAIRVVVFAIYSVIVLLFSAAYVGLSKPSLPSMQVVFLIAGFHMACTTIRAVCESILRPHYNSYLQKQIKQVLKGPCPAQAILLLKHLESRNLLKEKKQELRPIWDAYLENKVRQYQKQNLSLAIQYAYCISSTERRKPCIERLKELFKASKNPKATIKTTRTILIKPSSAHIE